MERKYTNKLFRNKVQHKETRKAKTLVYGNEEKAVLKKMWEIFDRPCGQRLKPLIVDEIDRLINLKEVDCSEEISLKLKNIGTATIDRKLKITKEEIGIRKRYSSKLNLLSKSIPIKTSADIDTSLIGHIQIDLVESCGDCAVGQYVNSLSATDIYSGWWEGEAFMGKGQEATVEAIDEARMRMSLLWKEAHSDNGTNFINYHLQKYCLEEKVELSRSRPYKKNDNCYVEQKNGTHVRNTIGYLRYDTKDELDIINDLYRNELRLYKNFFQPVMKLVDKVRVRSHICRKYDLPKTPYQRVMAHPDILEETKKKLREIYLSLNPAELKRGIDGKLKMLNLTYDYKKGRIKKANFDVIFSSEKNPISVS